MYDGKFTMLSLYGINLGILLISEQMSNDDSRFYCGTTTGDILEVNYFSVDNK